MAITVHGDVEGGGGSVDGVKVDKGNGRYGFSGNGDGWWKGGGGGGVGKGAGVGSDGGDDGGSECCRGEGGGNCRSWFPNRVGFDESCRGSGVL